jgi:DNA-binding protein
MAEKATVERKTPTRSSISPDTTFIGQKPIMTYVTAIVMHFNSGSKELTVKARNRLNKK